MKFKALIFGAMLLAMATLSSGFIYPSTTIQPTTIATTADEGGQSFVEFLSHFPKIEMPYELKLEDMKFSKFDSNRAIMKKKISKKSIKGNRINSPIARTKYIPEITSGMFSRMGPPQVEAVARFFPNKKSIAVIYTVQNRYDIGGVNKAYQLLIYDLKGKILFPEKEAKNKIVYQGFPLAHSSRENTVTCQIDKEGHIWKKTYKNEWKEDLKVKGVLENEITSYTLTDTEVFKVNDKGIAVQLKEFPIEDRASLD